MANQVTKTLVSGYKRFHSDTLDIGCLVAAKTTVAPIIVFQEANRLSPLKLLREAFPRHPHTTPGEQSEGR